MHVNKHSLGEGSRITEKHRGSPESRRLRKERTGVFQQHEIAFVTSTMADPDEPQSFQEARWDPDLISREKWREAIHLEFKKMLDMGVWRYVKRNDVQMTIRWLGVDGYLR